MAVSLPGSGAVLASHTAVHVLDSFVQLIRQPDGCRYPAMLLQYRLPARFNDRPWRAYPESLGPVSPVCRSITGHGHRGWMLGAGCFKRESHCSSRRKSGLSYNINVLAVTRNSKARALM